MRCFFFALAALCLLAAAGSVDAQGAIRGTAHAPPGESVRGAVIVACFTVGGRCNYASPHSNSRAIVIESSGASARYVIRDLLPGQYEIHGVHDINRNSVEDAGDWTARFGAAAAPRLVTPPAEKIDLRFSFIPPASPPPSRPPPAPAGPPPAPAPAPAPEPGAGGMSGIYHGVKRQLVAPGPGSPVASGITWTPGRDWMTFFPDGRVFLAMPEQGLAATFHWEKECASGPAWCATYTVRGDEIRIRWRSGEEKTLRKDRDGTLWTPDRLNYLLFDRLNGLQLEGQYAIPWKEPYLTVAIQFTRDGRFSEQNLLNNIGWMTLEKHRDPAVAALLEAPGGSGTYALRDNTLELRYSDGRVARIATYIFPQELKKPVPEEIYIHAHDFRRLR